MQPLKNTSNKILLFARYLFDFQVHTVYTHLRELPIREGDRVLDVGCGLSPYRSLIESKGGIYCGIDIKDSYNFNYNKRDIAHFDGYNLPYRNNSFDWIICTEVLEHVKVPERLIKECKRVSGRIFMTTPFSARNHYQPYDYHRFSPSYLRILFGSPDLKIIPRGTELTVIANKLQIFSINYPIFLVFFPLFILMGYVSLLGIGSTDDVLGYTLIWKKQLGKIRG
jgi:ubiquinone/menaquinone biosynthesis C-methylase UbiE